MYTKILKKMVSFLKIINSGHCNDRGGSGHCS